MPGWLPVVDLACVVAAAALWELMPELGAWPLLLGLAPWVGRYLLTGRFTRRTAFDFPLLLFLLSAGLAVWAAYDRQAAWAKFWQIVGALLLFYALANAGRGARVRVWFLMLFGGAMAFYFLVTNWDTYTAKIDVLTQLGRALQASLPPVPGPRWNPNVVGGVLAILLPFAGLATIEAWREIRSSPGGRAGTQWLAAIASGCSLVLMSVGLVMTTSRGAWVALATALVLAGLWIVSGWLGQRRARWRGWLYPALLVVTLALALGLGIAWPEGPVAGIEALPGENTANSRAALMRSASLLVGDYPLVGAGLDSFMMLHSTYAWLLHVGYTPHSHNLTLNVAIEQGLVGLLALVAAWVVFFVLAARAGLFSHRRTGEGALAAAALSLIVLLVHGLLDNALYTSGGVFLLFAPLAFAAPLSTGRSGVRRQWLVPGLVLVLVTLLGALVWRGPILSLFYSNLGAVHQSQAELSVYRWPEWPIQDAVRREVDLSRPVAEFERALALNPRNAAANRRLGMIELSLGEYEGALAHLEAAYAVESGSMTTRQLYGEALIVNGRVDEGRALWAGVSNAHPQLDNRAWWYRHIGEAERAEWIEQAASDHP